MFTLAISCLTTSNLPWFMDLTSQVPMQYFSLQHWTLFSQTYPQLGIISALAHLLSLEKAVAPHSSTLAWTIHGWRSLVGCSPWGHWELDATERLPFHFSLSCIGEGNGNPLQCSCLENPRDRGAWWAAMYGVAQSRTWLKWPSSSKWGLFSHSKPMCHLCRNLRFCTETAKVCIVFFLVFVPYLPCVCLVLSCHWRPGHCGCKSWSGCALAGNLCCLYG